MGLFKKTKEDKGPAVVPSLPSYILTEARIPDEEGDLLLGRIVADFNNPSDEYKPYDPRPALKSGPKFLEIVDTEFSSLFSSEKNSTAQAKVGVMLNIDFDKLATQESHLKSSFVRTRILPQHRDAFNALMREHKAEILQLLRDNGGKGYMVVGYKSCVNGQMGRSRDFANRTKVDVNLPTGAIVTAATHGMVNLGNQADLGFANDSSSKQGASMAATMSGEQIFAVRCRLITIRKDKTDEGDFGDIQRVRPEHGVFGEKEESEEFITEDDNSDDETFEVVEGEELLLCGDAADESDPSKVIQSDVAEYGMTVEYDGGGKDVNQVEVIADETEE